MLRPLCSKLHSDVAGELTSLAYPIAGFRGVADRCLALMPRLETCAFSLTVRIAPATEVNF